VPNALGHNKKLPISKKFLQTAYYANRRSLADIADEIGCSFATIRNRLIKYGLTPRSPSEAQTLRKIRIPHEVIETEYYVNKKAPNEIVKKYGCSGNVIKRIIKELGLPLRSNGEAVWRGHGEISGDHWSDMQRKAEVRGICFQITIEQAWDMFLLQNRRCALSGVELVFDRSRKSRKTTASFDRIDSSKCYRLDNVQWIHKRLQRIKLDLDQQELISWCNLIADHSR